MNDEQEAWLAQRPKFKAGEYVYMLFGALADVVGRIDFVHTHTAATIGMAELPVIFYSYSVRYANGASIEAAESTLEKAAGYPENEEGENHA